VALTPERREAREDVLLGHILLKQKFVTPEQLKQAMAAQAAGLARGRKKPRRLGIILVEQKRINDQDFIGFLREVEERVQEEEVAREQDRRLGETLLARRVVSEDQLDECLRLQQEAFDRGDEVIHRLGELLIEEGYVKPEAVVQALAAKKEKPAPAPVMAAVQRPPLRPAHRPKAAAPARPVAPLRVVARPKPELPAKPVPRAAPIKPPVPPPKAAPPKSLPPEAVPVKPAAAPAAAPKPAEAASRPDIPLIDMPAAPPAHQEKSPPDEDEEIWTPS
jgi:hypothetical protein